MGKTLFDFRCSACQHTDEVWADDPKVKLDCPECGTVEAYERVYLSFAILQTNPKDSSNSWGSAKGKRRKTYGDGMANNGY